MNYVPSLNHNPEMQVYLYWGGWFLAAWCAYKIWRIWLNWESDGPDEICHECNIIHPKSSMKTLHCGMSSARICPNCFDKKPKREWSIQKL